MRQGAVISAVVVAAGKGARMKMDISKQYVEIAGKPVLAHTLDVFEKCEDIDEIILVVGEQDIDYCLNHIVSRYGFGKVSQVVGGGDQRQQSVYKGLMQVDKKCDIVLIHDGARPFISEEAIRLGIEKTLEHSAACIAVPVKDTIKVVDNDGIIENTLERSKLWAVQTPQIFRYNLIMRAHEKANEEGYQGTDDTVLVERMGYGVHVVMGSYNNIKITTQEDLIAAEAIAAYPMFHNKSIF